jgi:hypothetical protein
MIPDNKLTTWLAQLRVGDRVVIRQSGLLEGDRLARVERVTATQIRIGPSVFDRRTGRRRGDYYVGAWLTEPTPELVADIRVATIVRRLGAMPWKKVPIEKLTAIAALFWPNDEHVIGD